MQVTRNVRVGLELPTNPRTVLAALSEFGDPTAEDAPEIGFVIRGGVLTIETPPRKKVTRKPRTPKAEAEAKGAKSTAA